LLIRYQGKSPVIDPSAWVAPGAKVVGDVTVGPNSSIWFNAVVRSDYSWIRIGEGSNIQDNCVVHETPEDPVSIGDQVTIGHGAVLHGCEIGDGVLVGMGAIILDGAKVGAGSIIAAGSLVPERMRVPPQSLVAGSPGQVVKPVTDEKAAALKNILATSYAELWKDMRDLGQPGRKVRCRRRKIG
jgi:carbonic anhydrase/acetyltransferase-like protein (isoleucine patch superfamily)